MAINSIQMIIGKLNKIFSLFPLLFPLIICEKIPDIIIKNRYQINHLLNGQTFKKQNLICTFDSQYSIIINEKISSNNLKNFVCLIISPNPYLYIINSDDDDILCKYEISQALNDNINYTSLIPYLNNIDLNCIITTTYTYKSTILNTFINEIKWYIYQLEDFNGNITKQKDFSKTINSTYPIGSGVFDNSANLIFSYFFW